MFMICYTVYPIFTYVDPDPYLEYGSNLDTDPQHWFCLSLSLKVFEQTMFAPVLHKSRSRQKVPAPQSTSLGQGSHPETRRQTVGTS